MSSNASCTSEFSDSAASRSSISGVSSSESGTSVLGSFFLATGRHRAHVPAAVRRGLHAHILVLAKHAGAQERGKRLQTLHEDLVRAVQRLVGQHARLLDLACITA